jgi:hypothetical protein
MLQAIYGTAASRHDWSATRTEPDAQRHMWELELRVRTLESSLDHRLALLRSQIQGEIWMDRLKMMTVASWGVALMVWLRLIIHWLR